ncbi:MAG: DUF4270 family protein [Saprospiraceae bacterium]
MYKLSYLICGVFLLSIISACNEPGLIGSDLVEDEQVELFFTDTIHPQISTVRGDSVRIYAPSIATLDNYLFGNYNDPIFGNQNASLYFRLKSPEVNPDFDIANRIDSIVLILDIDSATVYGNALKKPLLLKFLLYRKIWTMMKNIFLIQPLLQNLCQ